MVSDYANLLNKSPKTLSNLFAKYNNKSPLQLINNRITLEAKKLLLLSEKSSKEIAYSLGFNDASHFSKFFKNQTGASPIHFKKNTLNIF
jgi:AraC family transcriptional activator of pobA